jgi:hypothetical protein
MFKLERLMNPSHPLETLLTVSAVVAMIQSHEDNDAVVNGLGAFLREFDEVR